MSTNSTFANTTAASHHHKHHGSHMNDLVDESISPLAPFSAIILTVIAVCVFAYRLYFIEKFLMNTKLYKAKFQALAEDQRRSLVNHHVAGTCKFILLCSAAYPFLSIAFGKANPHTPFAPGAKATLGDVMIVCSQLFAVMGAFDCIAELWPHFAMILYRLLPSGKNGDGRSAHFHGLMSRIFLSVAIMEVAGTIIETIVVFWLWGSLWENWTLPFKIVTPILHVLFSCAQGWGAYVFWQLSKKEARKAAGLLASGEAEPSKVELIEDGTETKVPDVTVNEVRRRSLAIGRV